MAPENAARCAVAGCGHALSMHNSLGYCRSRTTPDRSGPCICDSTWRYERPLSEARQPSYGHFGGGCYA